MAKVFVSYSRKDIEFAKRLTGKLQKDNLDFWVDWPSIKHNDLFASSGSTL